MRKHFKKLGTLYDLIKKKIAIYVCMHIKKGLEESVASKVLIVIVSG